MGKIIKIQGADFSDIALASGDVDITSAFNFIHTSQSVQVTQSGNTSPGNIRSTAYFDACDFVDVSAYRGKTIDMMFCSFKTGSGASPGYGMAWYDAEQAFIDGVVFPQYTGEPEGVPYGLPYLRSFVVPENATYLRTSYLGGTSGQALKTEDFSCVVKG